KTWETVGCAEYAPRRSLRPMSLRVTAEWEFLGEDLQCGSHFVEHPAIPALPFGPGEAFRRAW
ncbi:MAG TPA: hypothetical protein VFD48_02460, partial [Pyrinomonadaceae bacterium]|nr:hypothetical protein [Pyrinomonadaceae bacterium]